MATVYTLLASATPTPIVPAAVLEKEDLVPTTFPTFTTGDTTSVPTNLNQVSVGADVIGRAGAGAYAIDWDSAASGSTPGLNLTVSSGLTLACGIGTAMIDGPVQVTTPLTIALVDNTARTYIYLSQAGALAKVENSLTPPAGRYCFLGSVVTAAGAITEINGSGVCYLRGPHLVRKTADTGCPSDTPPAGLGLFTQCAGGLFFWDGENYHNCENAGRANLTFSSDANKTLTSAEACNAFLDFTSGGTALTVTRNVVVPLSPQGRAWRVRNNSNGGQSIQVIGATGTGITIATTKTAIVSSDGTNIVRITADA